MRPHMMKHNFFPTEVDRRRLLAKLRQEPSLVKALTKLRHDTVEIDEYAHKQLRQLVDDFLTVQVLGPQGSGKSGVGQFFAARYWNAPGAMTAEKIELHYDQFLEVMTGLEKGEFALLDEQTKLFGAGAHRIAGDIVNIIETLRKNGGSIIIISPTEKMVDVYDVHLEIEVLARDGEYVLCAWRARSEDYLGSFILRLDWESPLWQAYEEKKNAYVKDAKARQFHKNDYERLAEKILAHPDMARVKKRKHLSLIVEKELPNLTIEEKKLVIAQIEMLRE